ncbi:MAG: hypothetical protein CMM25_05710 [Rhodospirillaceae bacterium]|nr:hypothetical protein [Rhodospirillaceae bacterium]|tara:strand:+ start:934 stop:1149 length:216 start_codon:yes stop_codon:yes gene_type:complete
MLIFLLGLISGLICHNGIYKLKINEKMYSIDYKYATLLSRCDPLDVIRENEILLNITRDNSILEYHPDDYN